MKVITPTFATSDEDARLIIKIARRAVKSARSYGRKLKAAHVGMDITAAHANGCSLDLAKLLNAPDLEFDHDVFGIRDNLDRKTGKLFNCFLPRYTR